VSRDQLFRLAPDRAAVWAWVTDTLDPEDTLVVGRETLYRLTADRTEVQAWDQPEGRWHRIGGAARTIHAGGAGLFTVDIVGGVRAYQGTPNDWKGIGDAAADIAVGPDRVYRLSTDGTLSEWSANTWHDLNATAQAITVVGR